MIIVKIIVFVFFWTFFTKYYSGIKSSFMQTMKSYFRKIKYTFQRIYRLLNLKKASHYVWIELLKFHKSSGWNFGQFDNDKHIECGFKIDAANYVDFNYAVSFDSLIFRSTILQRFDEEITNDILVLASHFNGLLSFGVVKVSVKYNYVEFVYSRDLLTYSLFPSEIDSDTDSHYKLTEDCFWSFTNLIESGDDPVFVFSEFLRRKEAASKNNIIE